MSSTFTQHSQPCSWPQLMLIQKTSRLSATVYHVINHPICVSSRCLHVISSGLWNCAMSIRYKNTHLGMLQLSYRARVFISLSPSPCEGVGTGAPRLSQLFRTSSEEARSSLRASPQKDSRWRCPCLRSRLRRPSGASPRLRMGKRCEFDGYVIRSCFVGWESDSKTVFFFFRISKIINFADDWELIHILEPSTVPNLH